MFLELGFRGWIRAFPSGVGRMGSPRQEDQMMQRGRVAAEAGCVLAKAGDLGAFQPLKGWQAC